MDERWSYGLYGGPMDCTLVLWIVRWSYGLYGGPMDDTVVLWVIRWSYE